MAPPLVTSVDTAYTIAVIRSREAGRPARERLFDDPFAVHFGTGGAEVEAATERMLGLPFIEESTRLRTRFIDDELRAALARGVDQIVLLGAGFDARGHRIAEIPAQGARVYEVDFASQLETKRALLAAGGVTLPPWIAYVPCDFGRPDFDVALGDDLALHGLRGDRPAFFVWEGVIGYIDAGAIDRTLAFAARVTGKGSRLVFTFGAWTFDPEGVVEKTRRAGFSSCENLGFDDLWRRYLPGAPHEYASAARMGVADV